MVIFTPDEVVSLNGYQQAGHFHPFTCGFRANKDHRDDGVLVATVRGWICPYCDYAQYWAHDWMKDGRWAQAFQELPK